MWRYLFQLCCRELQLTGAPLEILPPPARDGIPLLDIAPHNGNTL